MESDRNLQNANDDPNTLQQTTNNAPPQTKSPPFKVVFLAILVVIIAITLIAVFQKDSSTGSDLERAVRDFSKKDYSAFYDLFSDRLKDKFSQDDLKNMLEASDFIDCSFSQTREDSWDKYTYIYGVTKCNERARDTVFTIIDGKIDDFAFDYVPNGEEPVRPEEYDVTEK
jgi:hypothetical protein